MQRQGDCSHACWVQVLGSGHERPGLAPTEPLGCVCSKPQLLGGSHLIWHKANARSLPRLGMAARRTDCVEILHAGVCRQCSWWHQPGSHVPSWIYIQMHTQSISSLFPLLWGCNAETPALAPHGHSRHRAVFICSGTMLCQSCCALCRAELTWEQSAHVYVAFTPANLPGEGAPVAGT